MKVQLGEGWEGQGVEVLQLLAGRDFARARTPTGERSANRLHQFAVQMANYCYAVVDRRAGEAILIDPCWDVEGILERLRESGVTTVRSALFTHRHFDHTGGRLPRSMTRGADIVIEGLKEVVEFTHCFVGVGRGDVDATAKQTGVDSIETLFDGQDTFRLGLGASSGEEGGTTSSQVRLEVLETPGHTPGSVCFLLRVELAEGEGGSDAPPPILISGDSEWIIESCDDPRMR